MEEQQRTELAQNYLNKILESSQKYLEQVFSIEELRNFLIDLRMMQVTTIRETIDFFIKTYEKHIKQKYQLEDHPNYDRELHRFIKTNNKKNKDLVGRLL